MPRFVNLTIFVLFAVVISISGAQETSGNDYHECLRPCLNKVSSTKICSYKFFVSRLPISYNNGNKSKLKSESQGRRNFLGINGKSPGPNIEICIGDTIEVLLYNRLGTEELSLHWHGLRQTGSVHMDGVPMVTQCSILPYGGFRYKIKPEGVGTYFYHAHSVSQQGDGVYGSLTVRGPQDKPALEWTLLLSSRPPTSLTRHSHLYPPTPSELLVNGQNDETLLKVSHGTRYLLRLVNANAYNCPVLLSTSGHAFQVFAADGNLVQSMTATRVVLFPGERLDVVFEARQDTGKYLIDVRGLQDCKNLQQRILIVYDDAKGNSTVIEDQESLTTNDLTIVEKGYNCDRIAKNLICALDLKAVRDVTAKNKADEVIYIPFDITSYPSFTDEMTDNRYNFYESVFYPAYLSMSKEEIKTLQVNGMSFKYPSSPILSQPQDTPAEQICSLEQRSSRCAHTPLFCECIQIIDVPVRKTIEIILIDEGFGGNVSYTFHVHGYSMSIMGRESFGRAVTKEEIFSLDQKGKIARNFANPPRKDSFVVPNKGYVVLRFYTDNLGYWLWEARNTEISLGYTGPGIQFLLRVGNYESLQPIPLNFPTCGNNKGPDLIFHTN